MNSRTKKPLAKRIRTLMVLIVLPISAFCQTEDIDVLPQKVETYSVTSNVKQATESRDDFINKDKIIYSFNSEEVKHFNKEEFFDTSDEPNNEPDNVLDSRTITVVKNPGVAFAFSFVLPGGGQFYNGESGKGIKMLGAAVAGVALFYAFIPKEIWTYDYYSYNYGYWEKESGTPALAYAGLGIAVASSVWSMVDAINSAKRINKENGFANADKKPKVKMYLAGIDTGETITPGLRLSCSF